MTLQLMETGANNKNHSLFDHAAFKKYDTVNLELSVQLSQNELSFCIKSFVKINLFNHSKSTKMPINH